MTEPFDSRLLELMRSRLDENRGPITHGEGEWLLAEVERLRAMIQEPVAFRWKDSLDQINWHYTTSRNPYIPAEAILEPLYLGPPADGAKS